MNEKHEAQYDVILVGSGTGNATLANELSAQGKRVLLLEQGQSNPLGDSFFRIASIVREMRIGKTLGVTTAVTLGGSTALYFAVCKLPNLDGFRQYGVNLEPALEEVRREIPMMRVNSSALPAQSRRIATAAQELGHSLKFNDMLIDSAKCPNGQYAYDAKWRARSFIEQAVSQGTQVITGAKVTRVLLTNGCATGVEYEVRKGLFGKQTLQVHAKDIVLGGGAFSTPILLRKAGMTSVGKQGFFCKPGYMLCGLVKDMQGGDAFVGSLELSARDGVSLGDGTMNKTLFRLAMLANGKIKAAFSHQQMLSVGILLDDSLNGELDSNGCYQKSLTAEEQQRLDAADKEAVKILERAGAFNIFRTKMVGGLPGGSVRFGDHLDANLETSIANLYVCDHSLLFDSSATPTVPLICLGKYLAKHLQQKYQPKAEGYNRAPVVQDYELEVNS